MNIDLLQNQYSLFILRRADVPYAELFNIDTGTLNGSAVDFRELPGFSMNLIGAYFKTQHLKFNPSKIGSQNWPGGEKVYLSEYLSEYSINRGDFSYFYIGVSELHGIDIPFVKKHNKDAERLFKELRLASKVVGNSIISDSRGKSFIVHSPTYLNYWHVELEIFDPNPVSSKKMERGKSKGTTEVLGRFLIDHVLTVKAVSNLKDSQLIKIDKSFFLLN